MPRGAFGRQLRKRNTIDDAVTPPMSGRGPMTWTQGPSGEWQLVPATAPPPAPLRTNSMDYSQPMNMSVLFPLLPQEQERLTATDAFVQPVGPEMPRRGLEPPTAPRNGEAQHEMEAQAMREARQRAHQATITEGFPYFQSPSVVSAGDALAAGVDRDRAARAEQSRRENVSWEDWWRLHGRQDGHEVGPFDFANAYRTSRPPPRFSAQSRRPGPR